MNQTVNRLIDKAEKSAMVGANDYMANNLLYCGECNTPKQCVVELFRFFRTVPCMCKCEIEKMEQEKRQREQQRKLDHIQRLRAQGIQDKQMVSWTFENDRNLNPAATAKAMRYYQKWPAMLVQNIGLLLWGDVGTGKTYTAACIANALLSDGVPVLMTNFSKLINALSGFAVEDKNAYIESLNHYKLLIIDDLGVESSSDFRQEIIFSVIDSRYKSNLPIIITTNQSLEQLKNPSDIRYSRIYDRILEMCVPIVYKGESLRKTAYEEKRRRAREMFQ